TTTLGATIVQLVEHPAFLEEKSGKNPGVGGSTPPVPLPNKILTICSLRSIIIIIILRCSSGQVVIPYGRNERLSTNPRKRG
ncbi:MAG: hypothetical protein KDC66_18005, partial [Phaeodactylibacter sp.]|nr:hypothetical protein [Phaeodactylibacter sp.]